MLESLHPWRSASFAYAAVAGVLLFASGLVSGWVDNWLRYREIPDRIANHPGLWRVLGLSRTRGIAAAMGRSLGAVSGNIFLGLGLGSMGTLGVILGLPLDIRHIAFASAEFGMALHALDFALPPMLAAEVGVSVALIGLINFMVSFGLSLMLAIEARGLGYRGLRHLFGHLGQHLIRRPLDWFFPPPAGQGDRSPGRDPSIP
jgi:site-specific recombinase